MIKTHQLKLFLLLLLLGGGISCHAQQFPFFGFYRNIPAFYNPATAGLDYSFKSNLLYRSQWTGLEGAPISYLGQVNARLDRLRSGVGLNVVHDEIGYTQSTEITGNYNYQLSMNDNQQKIAFGFAPKFYFSERPTMNVDSSGTGTPTGWERTSNFTMNAGAVFKGQKLLLGASVMNILPAKAAFKIPIIYAPHTSVMASYDIRLTEQTTLVPAVHLLTDFNVMSVYLNARVQHQKLWWQLGYHNRTIIAAAGYRFLERINVGYMIEYDVEAPIFPHIWSHEVFLAYELK